MSVTASKRSTVIKAGADGLGEMSTRPFYLTDLLDEAKHLVAKQTGIRVEDILVSATHTHTAPSVAGALGTGVDESYREFLPNNSEY